MNPILLCDGYKLDHRRQYPDGTTKVYSNWTPRESRVKDIDQVVFFGLQYFLKRYLENEFVNFFEDDCDYVCSEYLARNLAYLGPNDIGCDHIRALHKLGYIPLEFRAVPEGTRVPLRVPMLTVENTHPDFFWLVNYFETLMSCVLWQPCTSATLAYEMRDILNFWAAVTGSPREFVQWQGHDFSFRGMTSPEVAAVSGMGHLLSFTGTDTIPAIELAERYYGARGLVGGSVPATEHSVMCAGGELSEKETFERLMQLYPKGIVSVVSDTWDLWNVLTNILPQLKDQIMARDGKVVIRPDSGDPADIICGDGSEGPAGKGAIELLWDLFGGTTTRTGHRVLDSHIGCIYGDSITLDRANEICRRLSKKGFASCNMVFGVGSYTYQYNTRDTFGFAMKATWCEVNGVGRDLFKAPKTGNGMKTSARGRLAVTPDFQLINCATAEQEAQSILQPVWRDGRFIEEDTFDNIRGRLNP